MKEEKRVGRGQREGYRDSVRQRVKYRRNRVKQIEIQVETEENRGRDNLTEVRHRGKMSATEKI